MINPFFSVILTTYNRQDLLPEAVQSVLLQTFGDFELIIVDDGSTDNTRNIVKEFSDKRIKFISQENKGAGSARNTGIKNSNGKFICFLDDDDQYLPVHLETLRSVILENNSAIAMYRTFALVRHLGKNEEPQAIVERAKVHPADYIMNNVLFLETVCLHSDIIRKCQFNENIPLNIDYDMWLRVLSLFPLVEIKKYTALHIYTQNSLSGGSVKAHRDYIDIWKKIFSDPVLSKFISKKTQRKILYQRYLWLASELAKKKNFKNTLQAGLMSFFYEPGKIFSREVYGLILRSI
jgi:glycosyltransferase involved in cell wall biosynthesis